MTVVGAVCSNSHIAVSVCHPW